MNQTEKLLETFKKIPMGLWLFSKALCVKAPYFSSITPQFINLGSGYGEARIRKKRSVQNHLGTVHAIAMANLCELVAGTTLEVTLPPSHRWIPKSMKINYLAKATTDVTAKTNITLGELPETSSSLIVHVEVFDTAQIQVVTADIEMYISRKKN